MFVGSKRLRAGDSVLFIRDEKSQLMVGVRRGNRQQTALPSSVLSADSMHIGVLAAAAHATANRTPFLIFYNPRLSPMPSTLLKDTSSHMTKQEVMVFCFYQSVSSRVCDPYSEVPQGYMRVSALS